MEEVQQETVKAAKSVYNGYVEKGLSEKLAFRGVGMQYFRFAMVEPKLFEMLFMNSDNNSFTLSEVLPAIDDNSDKILLSIQEFYGFSREISIKLYKILWIFTHGLACLHVTGVSRLTEDEVMRENKMLEIIKAMKSYGVGDSATAALKGVSLTVKNGDFIVLLGASGSGKSTLLNIMSGLERPDSGAVKYDGKDIAALPDKEMTAFRKEKVGFIFQQYYLMPGLSVDKNVKMGADLAGNRDYRKIIDAVGLGGKLGKLPFELSGGEQQRVSIARALAKKPKVLFLDEPTGALDEETGRQILDYICVLQKELGFSLVMVTHNVNIAEMAHEVVRMNSGNIVETVHNNEQKTAYEIGW
ncbi:lipoprotein-releasing system atp-binding protein lold [Holotrichia oblita]|nr:lipoprotein-releasing system atp-binding protein lold [Holotrichia oblita]